MADTNMPDVATMDQAATSPTLPNTATAPTEALGLEEEQEEEEEERTLTERAIDWEGDRVELDELIADIEFWFHDAMRADEDVDDDIQNACVELLANPGLPTLYRAQAELWMVSMVEEDRADDILKSARYWINDLEIVMASSGLDDPRIKKLKADAEELRAQGEPEKAPKRDPASVKIEAILAGHKAATQAGPSANTQEEAQTQKTADEYTVGIGATSGLPIRLIPGNKVTPADIGPEISFEQKLERNKSIARYERDVMEMEAEDEAEARRIDEEAARAAQDAATEQDHGEPAPTSVANTTSASLAVPAPGQGLEQEPEAKTEQVQRAKVTLKRGGNPRRGGNPSLRRKASNRAFADISSAHQLKKKFSTRRGLAELFKQDEAGGEGGGEVEPEE